MLFVRAANESPSPQGKGDSLHSLLNVTCCLCNCVDVFIPVTESETAMNSVTIKAPILLSFGIYVKPLLLH